MDLISKPTRTISGTVRVPGDKSISHRAVLLGGLAEGTTDVFGFLPGHDCQATVAAFQAMGVRIDQRDDTTLSIHGQGLAGLRAPAAALDLGNSGTAMRLLAGVLAGQPFDTELIGDDSLSARPMERVAEPLRRMGADIATHDGRPPLLIRGGRHLNGLHYVMPVASAQVKSALLLAGLYASGETRVDEPATTRDHTERMLETFGYPIARDGNSVSLTGGGTLRASRVDVPGDFSSAAFFMFAACLAEQGELILEDVGLNPSRTGFLKILELMGAEIEVHPQQTKAGEPCGRIVARPSHLRGADIPPQLVSLAIDEFPLVFIAAALADGQSVISGAEELRHKESDRIAVMANGLSGLGATLEERPDGAVIQGRGLSGGDVDSAGDHRVAMAFAIAAGVASGPVRVRDAANVATSFPHFTAQAVACGLDVKAIGNG